MVILLKQIFKFIKLLNSDTGTNQLAAGMACGFVLGMTPAFSLQTLLVFLLIFFFRIQMGAAFIAAAVFKFVAYLLDPVFHDVGFAVLQQEGLQGIFTTMYNLPIVPLTRFNNTIVMGSAVITLLAFPFVFFLFKFLITKYREKIVAKFENTKFWKALKATGLYKWYAKYNEFYG